MATPKSNIVSDTELDVVCEEFDSEHKKNVVRALFNPKTNRYVKSQANVLPSFETYLEDVDNAEKSENVSSAIFDSMNETGLLSLASIEMSPPITARKRPRKLVIQQSSTDIHEHSVGVSLLQSTTSPVSPPVISFNRKRCSESGQYSRTPYASNCGSPVMFGSDFNKNNISFFDDKNLQIDINTSTMGHDDSLLSPPIVSSLRNQHSTLHKSNVRFLSQSTPITHLLPKRETNNVSPQMLTRKRVPMQMHNRKLDMSVDNSPGPKIQQEKTETLQKSKSIEIESDTKHLSPKMNTLVKEAVIDSNPGQVSIEEKPSKGFEFPGKELSHCLDEFEIKEDDDPQSPGIANSTFKGVLSKCEKEQNTKKHEATLTSSAVEDEVHQNNLSIKQSTIEPLPTFSHNSMKDSNLETYQYRGAKKISPKEPHLTIDSSSNNSTKEPSSLGTTTYESSSIKKLLPCRFNLSDIITNKPLGSFLYPKVKRQAVSERDCLDNISIMEIKHAPDKQVVKYQKLQNTKSINVSPTDTIMHELGDSLSSSCLSTSHEKDVSIKNENNNSLSEFNMDSLTQIPSELINSQSPEHNENISMPSDDSLKTAEEKFLIEKVLIPPIKDTGYTGFQTAKGNKVQISDHASKAAKEKFMAEEVSVPSIKDTGFTGFQPAKENQVQISDNALKVAKEKFMTEESSVSSIKDTGFTGFQTAKGNKVQISEDALKAAKEKFLTEEVSVPSSKGTGFTGFQTAKGNKVQISDNALKVAKEKFLTDKVSVPSSKDTGFAGFQTAKGNKVQISEDALKAAKETFMAEEVSVPPIKDTGFTGFQPAKGNKVQISEDVLKAAKEKFLTEEDSVPSSKGTGFTSFQTAKGNKVQISSNDPLKAAKEKFLTEEVSVPSSKGTEFTGFQTAKGNKVQISNDALKAAKEKFLTEEVSVPSSKGTGFTSFQTAKGNKVEISNDALKAAKEKFLTEEVSVPSSKGTGFTGFQTAKGNKVQISNDSLKAAKEKFLTEEFSVPSSKGTGFTGFQTAKGNQVQISNDALKAAKEKFLTEEFSVPSSKDTGFTGFQTAKGNKVEISNDSLKAAKERFTAEETITADTATESDIRTSHNRVNGNVCTDVDNITESPKRCLEKLIESRFQRNVGSNSSCYQRNHNEVKGFHRLSRKDMKQSSVANPFVCTNDRFAAQNASLRSYRASPEKEILKTPVACGSKPNTSVVAGLSSNVPFNVRFKSKQISSCGDQEQDTGLGSKRKLFSYTPFQKKKIKMIEEEETHHARKDESTTRSDGKFYCSKKKAKKTFMEYVNYCYPESCSPDELLSYGISEDVMYIDGDTATRYKFDARKYFSRFAVLEKTFILCDSMTCLCDADLMIGVEEMEKSLLQCDAVEKKLVTDGWVENHYKHIVWKLASYERGYPEQCAGRALTPFNVMHQLKYRYDKEIDHAERSCLKRIFERDAVVTWRMVLFVSSLNAPTCADPSAENNQEPRKKIIQLSDGWYDIRAGVDQPLSALVEQGKIRVGTKLCLYGAELQAGSSDGCPPLEGLEKTMLILKSNSTRRASWDTKLGFQSHKMAFPLPLPSLYPDGGTVGMVNVTIVRKYPCQWMEKVDGRCIFRNSQVEEKAKKTYEDLKRSKMEAVYQDIQTDFESGAAKVTKRKRRSYTSKEISELRDSKEIYDLIQNSIEPSTIETSLTGSQRDLLADYKQKKHSLQQDKIMQKFNMKWKKICQDEFYERAVVQLQRYRVIDNHHTTNCKEKHTILTVWKPTNDITERLQEGSQVEIYHLNTSQSRSKQCSFRFQLSTTNSTKYKFKDVKEVNEKENTFVPRLVYAIKRLYELPPVSYGEVDVIGCVLLVSSPPNNSRERFVYICDGSNKYLAVKFWNGLQAVDVDMKEDAKVSFTNLFMGKFPRYWNGILQVEYTDLSSTSRNPKLPYPENAMKSFCNFLVNNKGYTGSMKKRLKSTLQTERPKPKTPCAHSSTANEHQKYNIKPENLSTPNSIKGQTTKTPLSDNLPSENLRSRHKLQIKKRLSLEKFREPPDLNRLNNTDCSVLTSQFKPPSSTKKR